MYRFVDLTHFGREERDTTANRFLGVLTWVAYTQIWAI